MPALFAYLIAVGLLLGGGYGALSWLAAPEPVKVVAKAQLKTAPSHYPEYTAAITPAVNTPETSTADASGATVGKSEPTTTVSTEQVPLPPAELPVAASGKPGQTESSAPAPHQQVQAADAAAPPVDNKQEAKPADAPPAQSTSPVLPRSVQTASSGGPAATTAKRSHPRQASRNPEKRRLALMTLRTIEFPDGRRVSQLIPYRSGEHDRTYQQE